MLISVRLRIQGDFLDVDKVTSTLGVEPHLARVKGQIHATSSGKSHVAKTGRWEWYSEDQTRLLSIDEHISRLKTAFALVLDEFGRIPEVMKGWIDVSIVTVNNDSDTQVTFFMNHESVETINKIGFPIEFSIYTLAQEDE